MAQRPGRDTSTWRRLRLQLKAKAERERHVCWICGQPIDYSAPTGTPDAWEPDHIISPLERPDLAEDPANIRSAHSSCNRSRGLDGVLGLGARRARLK